MRWLMMCVAIVLGAGITWLLTVRRVTRQVTLSSATANGSGERPPRADVLGNEAAMDEAATDEAATDEAEGFGGATTQESSSRMGWDRTSQDEDALFPHDLHAGDRGVTGVPPIQGATPNGDLAGVTAPGAGADPSLTPVDEGPTVGDLGPELGAPERDDPEAAAGEPESGGAHVTESATPAANDDPPVPGPAGVR
ncbi:hypothetical protein GCM10027053_41060 [Intrasporangium mesophilum]